jgi:hypothetical protein
MLFRCRPVGLDFIERAPWRFENVAELEAPAERVFDLFADGESWPRWFEGIRDVQWTSPEPKGVGTTRTVRLSTATVYEHFLVWEPGRRFTFRFEGANRPLFRAGIEDYRLEDLGAGRCRFLYGVYVEPTTLVRLLSFVVRPMLASSFEGGARGLERYVKTLSRAT